MLRKKTKKWQSSEEEFNPLSSLANMSDVMFVFSVGLIVALLSAWHVQPLSNEVGKPKQTTVKNIEQGKEMKDLPNIQSGSGEGFQEMGRVYMDPRTGKLIMVQQAESAH